MELLPDHRELLAELNDARVEYMVVGAYALAHHGHVRATKDFDIFFNPAPDNCERLHAALASFGYRSSDLTPAALADPNAVHWFGQPPGRVDLMGEISGVTFAEAWAAREQAGGADGTVFPVIGFHHLVANKKASGRPQDLIDVNWLEAPGEDRWKIAEP